MIPSFQILSTLPFFSSSSSFSPLWQPGKWATLSPDGGCNGLGDPDAALLGAPSFGTRRFPAICSQPVAEHCRGTNSAPRMMDRGVICWAALAWGLAITLAKTFLELLQPEALSAQSSLLLSLLHGVWPTSLSKGSAASRSLPLPFTAICSAHLLRAKLSLGVWFSADTT